MKSQFYFMFVLIVLLGHVYLVIGRIKAPTTTIGDTTFYRFFGPATFDQANQQCGKLGKLAVVRNRTIAEKLKSFFRPLANCK